MKKSDLKRIGSKGGQARTASLSPDERTRLARRAANARVRVSTLVAEVPKATHSGELAIGDLKLPCAVLTDGRRVLSERGVMNALGGKRGGAHWRRKRASPNGPKLPVYISANNLAAFIKPSLAVALSQPVVYQPRTGGSPANGLLATLLPEICDVWLKARRAEGLVPTQEHIARAAEVLIAALANVGIVALVDEATGYQDVRDRDELHRILEAYISKELLPWSKRFPDEFYQEMFRLRGWTYSPPSPKRPKLVGKLTNQIVYEKLPPGVLGVLRERNPVVKKGRRLHKHHQLLTEDVGNPHLGRHLIAVTTLMRAAPTWGSFQRMFRRAFPGPQMELPIDWSDGES